MECFCIVYLCNQLLFFMASSLCHSLDRQIIIGLLLVQFLAMFKIKIPAIPNAPVWSPTKGKL